MNKILFPCLYIFLALCAVSCRSYFDLPLDKDYSGFSPGSFTPHKDSNVLIFRSSTVYRADHEISRPKNFKVMLPKKIRHMYIENNFDFAFFYDAKQVVYIHINPESKSVMHYEFEPERNEMENYISDCLRFNGTTKYDLSAYPLIPSRTNMVLRRGAATILLINIKEKDVPRFFVYLNTFQFLPREIECAGG